MVSKLITALALVIVIFTTFAINANDSLKLGIEQTEQYLPLLKGKRVGLLINQTSTLGEQHLVDLLVSHGVNIKFIFAPEHGFRGDHHDGQHVASGKDIKTGIEIVSIYGKNKKPAKEIMQQLDVIIFDIQDVGVRFYTFISSMHYMMEAAAEHNKAFIVLDRPNPNGRYVDGPIREEKFKSFVGMHPIPLLHGLTVGELAKMIKGQQWITSAEQLQLTVIKLAHYHHHLTYELPIRPSPNLPNNQSIKLYPSLGFFEATPISIGRGTDFPFQVIGYDKVSLGAFEFTPRSIPGVSLHPKLKGITAKGQDLRDSKIHGLDLTPLLAWRDLFAKHDLTLFNRPDFMDKLAGTDKLRLAIEKGLTAKQIKANWQADLAQYKKMRAKYMLYP